MVLDVVVGIHILVVLDGACMFNGTMLIVKTLPMFIPISELLVRIAACPDTPQHRYTIVALAGIHGLRLSVFQPVEPLDTAL